MRAAQRALTALGSLLGGGGRIVVVREPALRVRTQLRSGGSEGVGEGDTAGVWEGSPNLHPQFRAIHQKKLDKKARAAKAAEMI